MIRKEEMKETSPQIKHFSNIFQTFKSANILIANSSFLINCDKLMFPFSQKKPQHQKITSLKNIN